MKKLSILAMGLLFVLTTACSVSGSGTLFDGKDSNKWKMTGDVSVQDDIMTLKGTDALVVPNLLLLRLSRINKSSME